MAKKSTNIKDKPIYGYISTDLKLRSKPDKTEIKNNGMKLTIDEAHWDTVGVVLEHIETGYKFTKNIDCHTLVMLMDYAGFKGRECKKPVYLGIPRYHTIQDPYRIFVPEDTELSDSTKEYIAQKYEAEAKTTGVKSTKNWEPGKVYSTKTLGEQSLYIGEVVRNFQLKGSLYDKNLKVSAEKIKKHFVLDMTASSISKCKTLGEILETQKKIINTEFDTYETKVIGVDTCLDYHFSKLLESLGLKCDNKYKGGALKYLLDKTPTRAETNSVELDIEPSKYIDDLYSLLHDRLNKFLIKLIGYYKSPKYEDKTEANKSDTFNSEDYFKYDLVDVLECTDAVSFCTESNLESADFDITMLLEVVVDILSERFKVSVKTE